MNPGYIIYGKGIGEIGERIGVISKEIGVVARENDNSPEGLKRRKAVYLKSIEGFKQCKEDLQKLNAPSNIEQEHEKFVGTLELFIEGTKMTFDGIDTDEFKVREEVVRIGMSKQKEAELQMTKIADEIIRKITK